MTITEKLLPLASFSIHILAQEVRSIRSPHLESPVTTVKSLRSATLQTSVSLRPGCRPTVIREICNPVRVWCRQTVFTEPAARWLPSGDQATHRIRRSCTGHTGHRIQQGIHCSCTSDSYLMSDPSSAHYFILDPEPSRGSLRPRLVGGMCHIVLCAGRLPLTIRAVHTGHEIPPRTTVTLYPTTHSPAMVCMGGKDFNLIRIKMKAPALDI